MTRTDLAYTNTLGIMRLSPCVLVRPDGWARGEREGYGEPCDVTSLSLYKRTAQTHFLITGDTLASDR